jgi:hypothetical protein
MAEPGHSRRFGPSVPRPRCSNSDYAADELRGPVSANSTRWLTHLPLLLIKGLASLRNVSTKVLATGVSVRSFNVTVSYFCDLIGTLTGSAIIGSLLAPKCSIESGSIVRNSLAATKRMRSPGSLPRGIADGPADAGNQPDLYWVCASDEDEWNR